MKRALLLFPLLLLAACEQQQAGEAVTRIEIGKGEVVRDETLPSIAVRETDEGVPRSDCTMTDFEGVPLTHCIADPARHRIEMDLGPDDGAPYRSLAALAEAREADTIAFAVNGGMYGDGGEPIGYYVEGSRRLAELNRADGPDNFHMKPNGVFYGSGGRWRIRTSEDFYRSVSQRPQFGTQSGPMLVVGGELHPDFQDNGPSRAIRNGVGVDKDGRAHFVISEMPISFGQLARFYRDELDVDEALYLDGNVSALWDPAQGRLDRGTPIGPIIVVTRREGAGQ